MSGLSAVGTARHAGAAPRCMAAVMTGVLLLPVLAGCSASEGGRMPAAVRAVPVADRAQLAEGGGLTWGIDALPATLNAFQYDAGPVTDQIAEAVLPALFTLDERGRPTLNEDYLVSAEVTAQEPKQTVVYTLNPRARWSDGEPIGAADFIAQWKALGGQDNAYWTARNVGYDRIETVEAGKGKGEVLVTFAKPYADWQSLFTPLYPRSVTGKADSFNKGARDRLPVGAGPFSVKKLDRKRGRISLVRNEKWWGDPALLEVLVFAEVDREERLAQLASGKLDVAELDPSDADRIDAGTAGLDEAAGLGAAPAPERGPEAVPDAAPALLRLLEARRAAAGAGATARQRAAAERAAERYARALTAEQTARSRTFAARERETAERLSAYTVHRAYDAAYTQLALNGTSEALRDERVRWALARGLDRRALASEVHGPARLPVRPVGSHLWVIGQEGYRDNSAALGETGVQSASQLLDEAGWRGGPPIGPGRDDAEDGGDTGDAGDEADEADEADETAADEDAKTGVVAAPGMVPVRLGAAVSAARQRAALLRQTAGLARRLEKEMERDKDKEKEGDGELPESPARLEQAARQAEDHAEELARQSAAGVRIKEGKPLQLRFVLPDGPGSGQLRAVAEQITGTLGEVGVGTAIVEVDAEDYFSEYITAGDFDLALYSWPASAYPATDARPLFAKPQSIPGGELFIEQNYARVGTDHIDQLLDLAAGELDEDRRTELLNKADVRIWAAAGSVPLYQRPQLVAAKKDLAGVGAYGLQTPRYQDIGYRK